MADTSHLVEDWVQADWDTGLFDTAPEEANSDCSSSVFVGGSGCNGKPLPEANCDPGESVESSGEMEQAPYVGAGACATLPAPSWVPLLCILGVWLRRVLAILLVFVGLGQDALALDVQNFQNLEGGRWASLREADFGPKHGLSFSFGTTYARRPLSEWRSGSASPRAVIDGLVSTEAAVSVNAGFMRFGVGVPYHLVNFTEQDDVGGVGDGAIWIATKLPLHSETQHVAVGARVEGVSRTQFVSNASVVVHAMYEWNGPAWGAIVNGGIRFQAQEIAPQYEWGDRLELGTGLSWKRGVMGVNLEWNASLPLYELSQKGQFPMEVLGAFRTRVSDRIAVKVGAGKGMAGGIGSPQWRIFTSVDVRPNIEKDNDQDGLVNIVDRCPNKPEDKDGFRDNDGCPDLDDDRDGIADLEDECPRLPETYNDYLDSDGCPDRSGYVKVMVVGKERGSFDHASLTVGSGTPLNVLEGEVTAFRIFGKHTTIWAEAKGHPVRTDTAILLHEGDVAHVTLELSGQRPSEEEQIPDEVLCPNPDARPCVPPDENKVVLARPIEFALDSTLLTEDSKVVLDELAEFLLEHPEIVLLRVEGFADEFGGSAYNYDLSGRRANAVTKYLVYQGVPEERLTPLATGEALRSDLPKALRRVEFTVLIWQDLDGSVAPKILLGKK